MLDAFLHLLPQWSSFPSLNDWLKSYGLPTDNFVTFMTCTVNRASDVQLHLPWDVSLHLALLHVPLRVDMASWHVVCVSFLKWYPDINFNQFHSISLRFTFATRGIQMNSHSPPSFPAKLWCLPCLVHSPRWSAWSSEGLQHDTTPLDVHTFTMGMCLRLRVYNIFETVSKCKQLTPRTSRVVVYCWRSKSLQSSQHRRGDSAHQIGFFHHGDASRTFARWQMLCSPV